MDEWIRQAEVWVGQAESWIRQQPPEQIYVAAAVIALTILVFIAGVVSNLKFLLPCTVYPWHALEILVLLDGIEFTASCLKSSKSNTIVLSGLSGSGKTTLFHQLLDTILCSMLMTYAISSCQLRDGSSHQGTVTSMEENNDTFVLNSEKERNGKVRPVHIVMFLVTQGSNPSSMKSCLKQLGWFLLLTLKTSCLPCKMLPSNFHGLCF
ncbi:hypothetical protein HU200_034965 [Digitaria exilis]|uniref:Uncharacterized protein n=1 Tax=Digitaria exilis TaxID=1010633 RepID=A0A835BP09_9POAL|nr:hypothetical protein HU200_034965 [Digitaria exilis]